MTVSEILRKTGHKDVLGVELLLAHSLNVGRERLFSHPEQEIDSMELQVFQDLFNRFCDGEPVAYLVGKKEFYGLDFLVNDSVLIPRPETELLVDKVMEFCKEESGGVRILDIGTGSGAIAVALAKNLPRARVIACDISAEALEVAKENAQMHGVADRTSFVKSDLLANVEGDFDVVVANLPYIGEKSNNFVSKETLNYEPHVALFGGDDGLDLYRKLFVQIVGLEWRPKLLLGEFGFLQADAMRELLNKYFVQQGWSIEKDYASIERIFVVTFNGD
ncbi:peptide chain release factor N(5)-glutamine methyltransferase [Patescibacteria group bacterium]|nr:peptide chain release factor N(5)-glutamine methyltransferase [Patescibacteria group bacterium]MBU1702779.1 peptide chain release factor N(5)-glutamine methyltransferase [Patescibacteria group bacterium]MBU1954091.1 peptide chain release factor N(5)-glutamine methyltransferase [Patescibacteria group bacterium]